jgi:hypothetical protein
MYKKITLVAWGVKCGFFGASGLTHSLVLSAATACNLRNPSSPSIPAKATPVNPAPVSQKNSRRVRPQKFVFFGVEFVLLLIVIYSAFWIEFSDGPLQTELE